MSTNEKSIGLDDLPDLDISDEAGFCMTLSCVADINKARERNGLPPLIKTYGEWEDSVALPALRAKGYVPTGRWFTIEDDVFGPLIRGIRLKKGEESFLFHYG